MSNIINDMNTTGGEVVTNLHPTVTIKMEGKKIKCNLCERIFYEWELGVVGKYRVCGDCWNKLFTWLVDKYIEEVTKNEEHKD